MNRLSAEKIYLHADRLVEIKEKGDTYPVHMALGLTDYCNHRCIFCNSEFATADTTRIDAIDRDVLLRFLKEAHDAGLKAITICGSGEPLIYPDVASLLHEINKIGLEIGIFTNGAKLEGETRKAILDTCTFVRGSVNASNSIEHETVHRVKGDFVKIVENFRALVNEKRERGSKFPTIGAQFVFYAKNYHSIVEATKLWKDVGVDYIAIKPLIEGEGSSVGKTVFSAKNTDEVSELMKECRKYEDENYKVYTKEEQYEKTIGENKRRYGKCYGHAIDPNLWSDGNMYFCSNHEHEFDIIGNIYEQSFMEIWHGEKRKKRMEQVKLSECPRACRCDGINEMIWDYLHPDKDLHPNFV